MQEALSAGEAEDKDCPWCQKDPEGSGKPKWWRERAGKWQKFLGSDNKKLGEWLADHTFGSENTAQNKHDSDSKMHHTQAKQIPKERKGIKEGMSGQAGAVVDNMKEMGFPPSKEQSAEYEKRRKKSLESIFKRDDWDKEEKENTDEYFGRKKEKPWTSHDQSEYDAFEELSKLPKERLDKLDASLQEAIDGIKLEGKIREGMVGTFGKSLESIVRGDAEANPDMSPNEWLEWYKNRPKKKAEESNFGAGQRGLGYGNEGHTIVQGSGQSHTITEIPPEMEIIVHDVNDIKESKKEGYTTEAGNNKIGDPSRATDDDDSLLSPTLIKNDPNWRSVDEPIPKPTKDAPNPAGEGDDSLLLFPKEDSLYD